MLLFYLFRILLSRPASSLVPIIIDVSAISPIFISMRTGFWYRFMHPFEWHFIITYVCVDPKVVSTCTFSCDDVVFIAFHRVLYSPGPRRTGVFIRYWAQTLVFGLIAIGPQVLYFAYGIHLYCPELASGTMSAILPSLIQENRPWCDFVVPKIWSMYTFIQSEYWHVGLFRYYTPQQVRFGKSRAFKTCIMTTIHPSI